MKPTVYSYRVWWEEVNSEGKPVSVGIATGVTNSKDILASAFRQHQEMLSATRVQLSYYEI